MTDKEMVLAKMDASADEARQEFMSEVILSGGSAKAVARWFTRWYLDAGYKRLGQVLKDYAK